MPGFLAGWLLKFEDYYRKQTRNILNLMTDALSENPHRTFIWAEISYLDLWWQEQNADRRDKFRRWVCVTARETEWLLVADVASGVRRLVEAGQLEIVTGAGS